MLVQAGPHALSATEVLALFRNNTITVEAYTQSLLDRISERNETVKAWAYLDPEFVLRQARSLDQVPHEQRGPLHGVAVGIKDVMNTQDMPTQFGSPLYEGHRPGFDSSAVGILRSAGALIFGKTSTTEFAVLNKGPNTTNPHNPDRTPGGSSSGSAAAVADFQVPISLGAQTGGSIIRPASFTGTFAMKPTHNSISPEGQKTFSPMFDTFGFFARCMEDLQLLADVFALPGETLTKNVSLGEASVALIKGPFWPRAGPGTVAAMERAVTILESKGVKIEAVSLPEEISSSESLERLHKVIMTREARVAFLREYRLDRTNLHPEICDLVENKENYTHKEMTQALDKYASMRPIMDDLIHKYSAIITPSAVDEAPLGLDNMGSAAFNTTWTGFHTPVINIPAFVGSHDMPIGISLIGGRFCDQQLLRIGKVLSEPLMAEGGWAARICESAGFGATIYER